MDISRIHTRLARQALLAAVLIAATVPAAAQSFTGYATAGPAAVRTLGHRDSAWQAGGGAEILAASFGVGGEADYVYFPAREGASDSGRSRFSVAAVSALRLGAHASFRPGAAPGRRVQPFVVGGVALLADHEMAVPMLQFGGGIDWWVRPRAGVRLEVREQFPSMLAVRAGVVFR